MFNRRDAFRLGAGLGASWLAAPAVRAQTWPARPVTIIVPWAAGGGTDIVVRTFAAGFERELGQPINVINRTGGGGVTGHTAIATAAADGYTLGAVTSEIATFRTLGLADLGPDSVDILSRIATLPAAVTVKADSPWRGLPDMLATVRAEPRGRFTASGAGAGGSWHLAIAGLLKAAGFETDRVRWVPSQGGAPALQDVVAGGITMFTGAPGEAKSLLDAGRVRTLAVMGEARLPMLADVPTLREAGLGWSFENWFGLAVPRNVPAAIRTRIIELAAAGHARQEVRTPLRERGINPLWDGPETSRGFIEGYGRTTGELLRDLGLARS